MRDRPLGTDAVVPPGQRQLHQGQRPELNLRETVLILPTGALNNLAFGVTTWTAPDDPTSPFDDLVAWIGGTQTTTITGSAGWSIRGTIYGPNSPLTLSGATTATVLNAQMAFRTVRTTGSGRLDLQPLTTYATTSPGPPSVGLIR